MNSLVNNIIYEYFKLKSYKISKIFLKNVFDKLPFHDTLFQIKEGFNSLGIPNIAIQINSKNKNEAFDIPTPFISHFHSINEFILVNEMNNNIVKYINQSGVVISEDWGGFEKKMVWSCFAGFS